MFKYICCSKSSEEVKTNEIILSENELNLLNNAYKNLNNINDKEIPYFSFKGYTFFAKPCNIYDGDTFSVIFLFENKLIKYKCRCLGYDTAEMKPLKTNPNRIHEKILANKAKDRLIELLNKHETKLIKIECGEFDKYGRLLITVYNMVDKKSINQIMIDEGHGKVYDGGTKDKNW
jgi:endonuclease YncB( thermonuclease family)